MLVTMHRAFEAAWGKPLYDLLYVKKHLHASWLNGHYDSWVTSAHWIAHSRMPRMRFGRFESSPTAQTHWHIVFLTKPKRLVNGNDFRNIVTNGWSASQSHSTLYSLALRAQNMTNTLRVSGTLDLAMVSPLLHTNLHPRRLTSMFAVMALIHYHLCKLLLTVYDPQIPRLGMQKSKAEREIDVCRH